MPKSWFHRWQTFAVFWDVSGTLEQKQAKWGWNLYHKWQQVGCGILLYFLLYSPLFSSVLLYSPLVSSVFTSILLSPLFQVIDCQIFTSLLEPQLTLQMQALIQQHTHSVSIRRNLFVLEKQECSGVKVQSLGDLLQFIFLWPRPRFSPCVRWRSLNMLVGVKQSSTIALLHKNTCKESNLFESIHNQIVYCWCTLLNSFCCRDTWRNICFELWPWIIFWQVDWRAFPSRMCHTKMCLKMYSWHRMCCFCVVWHRKVHTTAKFNVWENQVTSVYWKQWVQPFQTESRPFRVVQQKTKRQKIQLCFYVCCLLADIKKSNVQVLQHLWIFFCTFLGVFE